MRASIQFMFLLVWGQDLVRCVGIHLTAPAHIAVGGEALLGCQFDLGDEVLYSVKWYKDDREIFRYVPSNEPHFMFFYAPGVKIDLSRSSSDVMTLTDIKPETAGVYRCEITGEAPQFAQAQDQTYVTVHVLPKTGPRVTGLKYEYRIGDYVSANCTSPGSRPKAVIKWLVNNEPVHLVHLQGPWLRMTKDPLDTIETTVGLQYMVLPSHYRKEVMRIKCQATIVPLYHKEVEFVLNAPEEREDEEESEEEAISEIVSISDTDESSPEPMIPSFETTEDYPLPEADRHDFNSKHDRLRDNDMMRKLREYINELDSKSAVKTTTTTEATENAYATDCATPSTIFLEALAVTLLMQVILFIFMSY